jgi:predicted nucleic acid-binding protein
MTVEGPTRFSVDSNVIAFLFSGDAAKADRAEALVVQGTPKPVISTQLMKEVTLVMSRITAYPLLEAANLASAPETGCSRTAAPRGKCRVLYAGRGHGLMMGLKVQTFR